ncbi:MAG: homoserine dehydrogenase [Chloroflexi bacterium]|nr:homoserine dehydrogenase [Chloroflexota bacterium]
MSRPSTDGAPIGVALLGLGSVGSGVAEILSSRAGEYARSVGRPIAIRRILVRDPEKQRPAGVNRGLITLDPEDVFNDEGVHVVIEMIGGEDPALGYLRRALESGRYVVTANKEVMAKHGPELLAIARTRGVDILYEASVGGGIPLIAPLKRDLLANRIDAIKAIINGTTNYILTRMAREGADYAVALAAAQSLGYAEADPRNDVEGIDAAYKLAIMASLAFRTRVRPDDVFHEGITHLTGRDFRYAAELGYAIKLLAIGRREDHTVQVRVHPALVPLDAPLAKVDGVFNAVQVEGDLTGMVFLQGRGAGSMPTTSAVVGDLLNVAHGIAQGAPERFVWREDAAGAIKPMDDVRTRYYLRLRVADRAGVLAQITRVLGESYNISIASIIQKEANEDDQTAELVIMTHEAREADMRAALAEVGRLDAVTDVGTFLRVEGG